MTLRDTLNIALGTLLGLAIGASLTLGVWAEIELAELRLERQYAADYPCDTFDCWE